MPDLPELSEEKKNELEAAWDSLLGAYGYTDDRLAQFDWELNQVSRLDWRPGGRFGGFWQWLGSQTEKTVTGAVRLAESWFRCLIFEYWTRFRSSSLGHETYVAWLGVLKQQASDNVESLWKGRSETTDGWLQNVCLPKVQKALTTIEGQSIKISLDLRLERARVRSMNQSAAPPQSPFVTEIEATLADDKSGSAVTRKYKTALGRKIDRLRLECGWSFYKLAEKTGLDKGLILGHVRKGKGAHPDTLDVYAQAFSKALGREITALTLSE